MGTKRRAPGSFVVHLVLMSAALPFKVGYRTMANLPPERSAG
jgi:hypothetical protein